MIEHQKLSFIRIFKKGFDVWLQLMVTISNVKLEAWSAKRW
jgi:hypothetical protein